MLRMVFFGLLVLTCSIGMAQIPNSGFEDWATDSSGKTVPVGWEVNSKDSIQQTSDAYQGSSAAKIKPIQGFEAVPSVLSIGFSHSLTNPDQLSAYVKTQIPNDDTVYFRVELFNNGDVTATRQWKTSQTIDSYQEVALNFDDVNNDSAYIAFQSGCCTELGGADPATVLKVDEVAFDASVGIQNAHATEEIRAYPNPASEMLKVNGLKVSNSYQYQFYNNLGQVAKRGIIQEGNTKINLKGLPNGVFQLFLENGNNGTVKSTKVVKE